VLNGTLNFSSRKNRTMSMRGTCFCRNCNSPLENVVLALGLQPLSNALVSEGSSKTLENYPLDFRICSSCQLGQIGEYKNPDEIFQDYTYLSSTSSYWLNHARNYVELIKESGILRRNDLVIEIASNDGYLLQYFQKENYNVLGIEPAKNVAEIARNRGIPTQIEFFGKNLAIKLIEKKLSPKLVICNNVLAHVPDINDFMEGLAILIGEGAIVTIEAPSMLTLLENNLFDTIYHEHFSYLNVISVDILASKFNLHLYHVEFLESHGGSYRYWLGNEKTKRDSSVDFYLEKEKNFNFSSKVIQKNFRDNSLEAIQGFRDWCLSQQHTPIGFGAAAKATVLLNAANITASEFSVIADNSLAKQKKLIPGANIPILNPTEVFNNFSSNLIIFPWNLSKEILLEINIKYPKFKGEIWTALPRLQRIS
jgi:hypothetical protein